MAGNQGAIDDVVRESALKQLDDLTAKANLAEAQIVSLTQAAIELNNATGNSRSFRDLSNNANAAATATARMQREINNAARSAILLQQSQQRLDAQNTRTAASTERAAQAAARAASPYQQLAAQYRQLTASAQNIGVTFGTASTQFTEAAARANEVRQRLDGIDQNLGNYQRNVGNYGNAITGAFQKAFSAVRTFANIMPGLGLSGAFLLIFEALKFIVEQFGLFNSVITVAELRLQSFKEALKEGGAYTEAVKNVSELRENIELAKEGFLDKNQVVKQFNDTLGKTVGQVNNLNEAEASLNKNAQAFIKFTFLKATANAALELSAKKATEAQLAAVQDAFEGATNGEKAQIGAQVINPFNVSGIPSADALVKGAQKAEQLKQKRIDSANDESKKLLKVYEDFQTQAATLAKNNKFNFFQDTKEPKTNSKQLLDEQLKLLKDNEEKILNDTESTYEQRNAAIEAYERDSYIVINKGEANKVLTTAEYQKRINETELNALKDRNKNNKDFYDQQAKIINDALKRDEQTRKDILKNSLDVSDQYTSQLKDDAQKSADEQLLILADQYAKGLIKTAEYQEKKKQIEGGTKENQDAIDIAGLEMQRAIRISLSEDTADVDKKLADAKMKRDKDVADNSIAQAEREAARKKELAVAEKQLGDGLLTFGQTLIDARYQNELNGIQEQKDALTERTKNEIDAENRSLDSAATKADKIAIINAKAQAQQDILDEKARQTKQKQAQADRIFAIAKIIENTAIGVSSALAEFPPNIPLAIVVGALGAVQVANVLATPIPKYEKGTDNAKGGLSIVGEAGREYVITPTGDEFFTPDKASFMDIPKGSQVIPHHELFALMANPHKPQIQNNDRSDRRMIEAMNRGNDKLVRAFKGKKSRTIVYVDTLSAQRHNNKRDTHFR